jgi:hypothetical protein
VRRKKKGPKQKKKGAKKIKMCLCGRRRARRRCAECGVQSARYETVVRDALDSDHRLAGFAWDARAGCGATRRRPDFLWTFDRTCVALEVDENEHAGYDAQDEARRVLEIERALGRSVFWVRVRVARDATREELRESVVASSDLIADLISLARKKVGDSQTKKNVTIEVKRKT